MLPTNTMKPTEHAPPAHITVNTIGTKSAIVLNPATATGVVTKINGTA
jgi:hypothetical protein